MKKVTNYFKAFIFGALIVGFAACKEDTPKPPVNPPPPAGPETIKGSITTSTTWKAGTQYILSGFVYVEDGATLTIEPGTIIKGEKTTKGSLFIKRGGKIIANGTAEKPIVFTSSQAKGSRAAGDWGGLVILGKAPVNKTPAVVEGEGLTQFGGTEAADNSGSLKYVRIEFAGIAFETDKEINGLTLGGVGSGTTIDYVQVSYSGDDSFEWFGGTVNAKHLIAYRGLDDDFDTDNGFSGNVQYGLIIRDPAVADQAGDSNAFESDNDSGGSEALPKTAARFANVTATIAPGTLDSKYNAALRLRRSSELKIYNSVFSAPYKLGVLLENGSIDNYISGKLVLQGIALQGATTNFKGVDETIFNAAANKNKVYTAVADLMLDANFNSITARPVGIPKAGSPLLTGGVTLPAGFEPAPYIGAFNTTDWTAQWANFDPQNTDYDTAK